MADALHSRDRELAPLPGRRRGRPRTRTSWPAAFYHRLLGDVGITVNGPRPWDMQVHDERLWWRLACKGTLGLGDAYVDGWWDVARLDEFIARVVRARVDRRIPNLPKRIGAALAALSNLQDLAGARKFGEQLKKEGYKGYFELDFLIDEDTGEIYLGELNPRITGASSITNHALFALSDIPLFLFHILEWMDQPYKIDVKEINERWASPENCDSWGQLILKHTEDTIGLVTDAPRSGIWRLKADGSVVYDRMDTHRRAVEREDEAFFLRITRKGDYLYEGADMGILVMRGRLMTDDNQLNERAKAWIHAMQAQFQSAPLDSMVSSTPAVEEIAGFKFL